MEPLIDRLTTGHKFITENENRKESLHDEFYKYKKDTKTKVNNSNETETNFNTDGKETLS